MCCALLRARSLPSSKPYRVRSHWRACSPLTGWVPFASFSPEPCPWESRESVGVDADGDAADRVRHGDHAREVHHDEVVDVDAGQLLPGGDRAARTAAPEARCWSSPGPRSPGTPSRSSGSVQLGDVARRVSRGMLTTGRAPLPSAARWSSICTSPSGGLPRLSLPPPRATLASEARLSEPTSRMLRGVCRPRSARTVRLGVAAAVARPSPGCRRAWSWSGNQPAVPSISTARVIADQRRASPRPSGRGCPGRRRRPRGRRAPRDGPRRAGPGPGAGRRRPAVPLPRTRHFASSCGVFLPTPGPPPWTWNGPVCAP
ncbi:hypothetical protein SALBM217S_09161 [Streptomyces griseoloalbus]